MAKRRTETVVLLESELIAALRRKEEIIREIRNIRDRLNKEFKSKLSAKQAESTRKLIIARRENIKITEHLKSLKKDERFIKDTLAKAKEARKAKTLNVEKFIEAIK